VIKVYVSSAFCKDNLGGNKAGVVLYEDNLSDNQKKLIAKNLGYAETAFITKSEKADFKIRFFTPAEEVPLCGHATIASFGTLNYLGMLNKNSYLIETKSGILEINIKDEEIFMEQNTPIFYENISYDEIKYCFNIECINKEYPIQIVSTGLKDILVPIKNEKTLNKLKPNLRNIKEISEKYNVVGTHLYTFDNDRIICRNFAPLYDVDEESATGTSNCALAGLLFRKFNIKRTCYIFEQGYSLNSPSVIKVKIMSNDNKEIDKIYVGGKSRFVEIKEIEIY